MNLFSSCARLQSMLQRHVNGHLDRQKASDIGNHLACGKKNGRKAVRYRKRPWSGKEEDRVGRDHQLVVVYVIICFDCDYENCRVSFVCPFSDNFEPSLSSALTTDMNLGHARCLASRAPTIDLWLEITKTKKFVIQGFNWIAKFQSQVLSSLQAKMAQQGKQMRVGARKGLAYHSVKLVLLANGNRCDVDYNTLFLKWQSLLFIWSIALSQLRPFLTHIRICSLWRSVPSRSLIIGQCP